MRPPRIERLRGGVAPLLLYPLLALLSFPTLGQLVHGDRGLAYAHDVFDVARTGVLTDWLAHGPSLWNTHLTAGNALLAQGNGPYAIDVVLGLIVGPFAAYAITAWLLAVVAGISMHLFLRDSLRLSTTATVGGAVVYLFGFWHVVYNVAAPVLPLLLWLIDGALTRGPRRWRFVLGSAVVSALALYQGLAQVVLLGAGVQLVYVLITSPHARDLPTRVGTWAATWILALAMWGPALISQLVILPVSQRTVWDVRAFYDPRPLEALRDTLELYSGALLGVPLGGGWGATPAIYGTYFLGVLGLTLVAVGIVGARRDRRTWFLLLLLVAIPVVDLMAILLTPLQEQLGYLKSFQLVRVRHLFLFAIVATAALGLEIVTGALLHGRTPRAVGPWRWAVIGGSAIPLAIAMVVSVGHVIRRRREVLTLETPGLGWALILLALALGAGLIVLVAIALVRDRRVGSRRLGGLVCVVLLVGLVGERAVYAHGERLVGRDLGTWADTLGLTPGQAFLGSQPGIETERVLTFGDDANRMGAVELLQADGYQAIYPVTYHAFFGGLIGPQLALDPARTIYFRQWGSRAITFGPRVDPELVALVGVRWLYVRGDLVPTVPGLVERFRDGDVTVYEVPAVLPRAFIAGQVAVRPDTVTIVDALAAADFAELRATAFLVDGPDADRVRSELTAPSGADAPDRSAGLATITGYAPDRVEIEVRAEGPGVLILTDVMAPGWVAERDGATVPIATVDATFRGVVVDPSTRTVVFRYVPTFTYLGFGLAGIALVVALAWVAAIRRRDARPRPTTPPAPAAPS